MHAGYSSLVDITFLCLLFVQGIIRSRGIGSGDGSAVFSIQKDGCGLLHCAAIQGHLEVCKYLVEELGGDPNIAGDAGLFFEGSSLTLSSPLDIGCLHICSFSLGTVVSVCKNCAFMLFIAGVTPFMASAQSGDVATVKYLLDHGADLKKADTKGRTVLHHAVCAGLCHQYFSVPL